MERSRAAEGRGVPGFALARTQRVPERVPLLARPRAVLFDLDGTLIDTMPTMADLAAEVIAKVHGMEPKLARELYLTTCGLPFCQQLEAIVPEDPRNAEAVAEFEGRKPGLCGEARMATAVAGALAELRAREVGVVVSSNNGTANVARFVQHSGFDFDLVLSFGEGMAKGESHIGAAERAFGVTRDELLFVGDSLHDGEIARECRIAFVGVAGTFSHERFARRFPGQLVVSSVGELPALVA